MRVGLIARAEDRGLGIQSLEFYRHVCPAKTLVVDMGELSRGFPMHLDRYPDGELAAFDGHRFIEGQVRKWLHGLDVVFSAETLYDWRLAEWAREYGCATVCQVNPEFFKHEPDTPHPDAWWAPTSWRLDALPAGTRVVPVPVATDRFTNEQDRSLPTDGLLRVLHVVGHRAAGDRNGTGLFLQALRQTRCPLDVTVVTQDRSLPSVRSSVRNVRITRKMGGVKNYWDLYKGQDLLALPRRYGGLCLPAQEAMAAGLVVAMSQTEPQVSTWPIVPMAGMVTGQQKTPGGLIDTFDVSPRGMALTFERLAADREEMAEARRRGREWAAGNSWEALLPLYRDELERACR